MDAEDRATQERLPRNIVTKQSKSFGKDCHAVFLLFAVTQSMGSDSIDFVASGILLSLFPIKLRFAR
jgi:hypothetical protein